MLFDTVARSLQIITASAVLMFAPSLTSLKAFGFSLGGGVDIDANGFSGRSGQYHGFVWSVVKSTLVIL